MTYQEGTQRLFIDGKLVASQSDTESTFGPNMEIGKYFVGQIDDIRISKKCRYTADYTPGRPEKDADTLALYHFDEGQGDVLTDSSGNGHHGKIEGAKWVKVDGPAISPPPTGNHALEFGGSSRVEIAKKFDVANRKPFTVEAWAKPTRFDAKTFQAIFRFNGDKNQSIGILGRSETWFSFGSTVLRSPQTVHLNQAVRVAVTRDGESQRLFIDGKLLATTKVGNSPLSEVDIGKDFIGLIGDIRISSVCRYTADYTPERPVKDANTLALYLFDEGQGDVLTDSSGNGHHGKIEGAKWVKLADVPSSNSNRNYVLEFEGTSIVSLPEELVPQEIRKEFSRELTVEAWAKPTKFRKTKQHSNVVSSGSYGSGIYIEGLTNLWTARLGFKNASSSPEFAELNRPVQLAVTYQGRTQRFFIDGKLVATERDTTSTFGPGLEIGKNFTGEIDDIRVSKKCRYTADYTPGRPVKDADTLALYHFDEGQGDVLIDSSGNGHHGKIEGAKWVRVGGAPTPGAPPASSIFNGKDLTGFNTSQSRSWIVENGVIQGIRRAGGGPNHITTLVEFGDFEISYRVQFPSEPFTTYSAGFSARQRIQLLTFKDGKFASDPLFKKDRVSVKGRVDEFNDVTVRCVGKQVKIVVNGETLADGEIEIPLTGRIGWNATMDAPTFIKDIRFTDLSKPGQASPVGSPFDALRRENIPADMLKLAGGGDPANARSELVAVFGNSQERDPPSAPLVSSDGRRVYVSTHDKKILRAWDTTTGKELEALKKDGARVASLSADGTRLVRIGTVKGITVSNAITGEDLITFGKLTAGGLLNVVAISPDGTRVVASNVKGDLTLQVWDAVEGKPLFILEGHAGPVQRLAFSPDGKRLATRALKDKSVKIWDAQTGKDLLTLPGTVSGNVGYTPTFSPDSSRIALSNGVYDAATGAELVDIKSVGKSDSVAFSPDGKQLAILTPIRIEIRDAVTGAEVKFWSVTAGSVQHLTYAPDGRHLLLGTVEGNVYVWRLE